MIQHHHHLHFSTNRRETLLDTWQGIFFCEFDRPRRERQVVVTLIGE